MKIVFVNYNYLPQFHSPKDWISRIMPYFGLLEMLAQQHEVHYITQINHGGSEVYNSVHCHFLSTAEKNNPFGNNQLIKEIKPEVVLVYGMHFSLKVLHLRWLVGKEVNIIIQSHGDKPSSGWRKYLQKLVYRSVNSYFFVSQEMAEPWIKKGVFPDTKRIKEVIPASSFFVPISREIAKAKTQTTGDPVFLWVGRLESNKDPLTVVRAFLLFAKKYPAVKLYMIYQTSELLTEIKMLLENNPQSSPIILVGKIASDELLNWYNSADFFVSGSHFESFGLAACEAMSCGVVPILTNIASFKKMTADGKFGLLYEAGSETSLLTVLEKAMQLNRPQISKEVLDHFRKELSFKAIGEKFIETINLL